MEYNITHPMNRTTCWWSLITFTHARIPLDTDNFGHASLREVLPWVDELQPERVYLVGAGCGWGDHDKANEELAAKRGYPHVQLAHDGLYLEGFQLYE